MDDRLFRYIALGVGGLILLLLILVLLFLLLDDDGGDAAPTTSTTSSETTTTAVETTTTAAETTTTSAETTTTVTEATTTTTTTVALDPLVLADNGIGGADFGATPEATVAYATAVLGPPALDTGWIDGLNSLYGVCPEPDVRGVEWGTSDGGFAPALTLLFTNGATTHAPAGTEHFFGYYYFGGTPALATVDGISYGSRILTAQLAYPEFLLFESFFDPNVGEWIVDLNEDDMNLLWGFATGVDAAADTLTSVNGGSTCGE